MNLLGKQRSAGLKRALTKLAMLPPAVRSRLLRIEALRRGSSVERLAQAKRPQPPSGMHVNEKRANPIHRGVHGATKTDKP